MKFHRVREIVMNRTGHFIFPVANLRQKRLLLADDDFNAPTDDEMPELVPTSDDEAPDPETGDDEEGPSSSNAYLNGIADPRVDADALPSPYHDLGSPPTAPSPPPGGVVPAGDTRGSGLESFPGRGPIRKYKGSTRPPTTPSELWQGMSKKRQKKAIAEYKEELAAAAVTGAAAPAVVHDAVPRLPLDGEPDVQEPHRERNVRHPPCCTARKLSRKEMESCPNAKKGLGRRMGKTTFPKTAASN